MVAFITLLYTLITIDFGASWSHIHSAFIESGQSFWAAYSNLYDIQASYWETCITASISTILADLYMIRCCWMVWGRRWLVILLPIISLTSAIASKIMVVYYDYADGFVGIFPMLYISFSLVTTLSCTLLIIYRIITVTGVRRGAEGRLRVYHCFIEVLVESSALYSITLILFLAFTIRGNLEANYLDIVASIAKGVAPTLLLGRVVAGHTRPNDDHDESTVSTLQFRTPSGVGTPSLQESTMQSAVFEIGIEAQPERYR
ncbi:uncharacterized protein EV420DRAFT_1541880 [Desarmillaria tabescens]|uniref:Uncharacterized protein n=1 Tax=Armillaria tabescens TaxID=1929756 RepID=A0AA39N699_ARMTA|nr:uncharacterized protein EV420DRAFT_1541880 [Desarmillaria tabescens]KAK0459019.1 hypothetical protein EV420DRAFT_1541880 [Desarmillaria tabescens]